MTVEEQIEEEQRRNDRLRLEIEDLKAEANRLMPTPRGGGSILRASALLGPIRERERQLMESDEKLATIRRKNQGSARGRPGIDLVPHPLDSNPDIAKRRAIVHQNSKLSSEDLCKKFDLDDVPLPDGWSEKFNVQDWRRAYKNEKCRRLIHKLISLDKRKAQ